MDFVKYRVKFLEGFKDGNILGGAFFKAGQIETVSETDMIKVQNSGGLLEVMETLIPNPKMKPSQEAQALLDAQDAEKESEIRAKEGEIKQAREETFRVPIENNVVDIDKATSQNETSVEAKPQPQKRKAGRLKKNAS